MKIMLSPQFEAENSPAYSFYREGIGFGEIKAVPSPTGRGEYAEVTFVDADDLSTQHLNDINLAENWQSTKPEADLSDPDNALRFISLGINSALSVRRNLVKEGYRDRVRKPRIARAMARKLAETQFAYSPVSPY